MKSFNCPSCDYENEVEMELYRGGDIDLTCCDCGREWTENPQADYEDYLYEQEKDERLG